MVNFRRILAKNCRFLAFTLDPDPNSFRPGSGSVSWTWVPGSQTWGWTHLFRALNTFVKQMWIFFNICYFDKISANSKVSQQRSFVHPQFFRILDFQAEPIEGFSHARPESDIYDVSMSKNFCTTILAKLRGVQHGQNA